MADDILSYFQSLSPKSESSSVPPTSSSDPTLDYFKSLAPKPGTPITSGFDKYKTMIESAVQNNPVTKAYSEFAPEFMKGIARGATFGAAFNPRPPVNPEIRPALTGHQKAGKIAGEFAGTTLASIMAEAAAGVAMPAIVAKYGLGAVQAAVAKSGLGMALFSATEGAVQNKPPLETANAMMTGAGLGMATHPIAAVAGKLISKVATPFAGSITPEIERQAAAAESVGIKPRLATLTNNPAVQVMDRAAEFVPGFGSDITKGKEEAVNKFNEYAQTVGDKISKTKDPQILGNLGKEALVSYDENSTEIKNKIYESVLPKLQTAQIDITPITDKMQEIIQRRRGTLSPKGLSELQQAFDELVGKEIPSKIVNQNGEPYTQKLTSTVKTFPELKRLVTNIGNKSKFNNPAISGLDSDLQELYGVGRETIDNAASAADPKAAEDLRKVNEFTHQGQVNLKSSLFKALTKIEPMKMHEAIFREDSPELAALGRELVGDHVYHGLERQWFNELLKDAKGSPTQIAKSVDKYKSILPEMFKDNPKALEEINKLADIGQMLNRGTKITEGSMTAFNNVTTAAAVAVGSFLTNLHSNPMLAAKEAGLYGLAGLGSKVIASDTGRKLLTTGFPEAGKAVEQKVVPAAKAGIANLISQYLKR